MDAAGYQVHHLDVAVVAVAMAVAEAEEEEVDVEEEEEEEGGSSSTTFNGVDCSDFSRDFTDDEFHKIGYEGRGYVRKKRQEAKNNNKRDVQEVNTHDDGDGPEKKPKSEKGGQNGSAFGRQKAGEKI